MKRDKLKLSEMGTSGLLSFVALGTDQLFAARLKRAKAVITARYGHGMQVRIFNEIANDQRADRNGWTKPKLSPLKRLEAADKGDATAFYHAKATN